MHTADVFPDHNQALIGIAKSEAQLRENLANLHAEISHQQSIPTAWTAQGSRLSEPGYLYERSRTTFKRTLDKKILEFSFGRVLLCRESSAEPTASYRVIRKTEPSHFSMVFVPSRTFWPTIVRFRLEWAARLNSLTVPSFNLQFLDVVQDDHPVIGASIRGDLDKLESAFSYQRASPLCSTQAGWTPLHFAAAYGQVDACRLLMAQGAPLDATGVRGITPLHLAAHFGHIEVFRTLVRAGSDPDDYHENGMNAILEMLSNEVVSNSPELSNFLKWLLHGQEQFFLDTEARDNAKRGILYYLAYPPGCEDRLTYALTPDQSEAIEFIVRAGIKGDEPDVYEDSLLHKACRDNRLDLVRTLLSSNCCVNVIDGEGRIPLHYAIQTRNFELVTMLVRSGSSVSIAAGIKMDPWGKAYTALEFAAEIDWVEGIKTLIQYGVGCSDKAISGAFRTAVSAGSLEVAKYFVQTRIDQLNLRGTVAKAEDDVSMIELLHEAGASLDDRGGYGHTPLAWAAQVGWYDVAERLVELGADLDKLSYGLTPLRFAAEGGHRSVVRLLLTSGARIDLAGDYKLTPWQMATINGYDEIADDIIRYADARFLRKHANTFLTAAMEHEIEATNTFQAVEWDLTTAAGRGDLEVIERPLEKGCSLEAGKGSCWSALSEAIAWGHWEVAKKLIEGGSEVNVARDGTITSPFEQAVTHGNVAFIVFIIQHGADVHLSNDEGSTPLLRSLDLFSSHPNPENPGKKYCHTNGQIVRVLLNAGANVNIIDKWGRTPLGKAAAVGNLEAVVALVKAGADLNRPSTGNSHERNPLCRKFTYRTPLAWAAFGGHEEVVKFLFDSGAEWRSSPREPVLTYAHRLLMQSCFPQNAEVSTNATPCVELLDMVSEDATSKF